MRTLKNWGPGGRGGRGGGGLRSYHLRRVLPRFKDLSSSREGLASELDNNAIQYTVLGSCTGSPGNTFPGVPNKPSLKYTLTYLGSQICSTVFSLVMGIRLPWLEHSVALAQRC